MADDALQIKFGADASQLTAVMQQVEATVQAGFQAMGQSVQQLVQVTEDGSDKIVQSQKAAQDAVTSMAEGVQAAIGTASDAIKSFTGIITGIGGVLAGGALFGSMISATTAWATEVNGLAKIIGMSKTEASDFNVALRLIGKTADDAESAMFKLIKTMRTNPEILSQLKVAYKDAVTGEMLPGNQVFMNAIEVVKQYKDGVDKDVVAMALFGKGAKEMMGFQKLNNDVVERARELAKAYHLELTEEGSKAVASYKMEMNAFKLVLVSIYQQIGNSVLPVFKGLAQWMNDIGPVAAKTFGDALKYVIVVAEGVAVAVRGVVAVMAALAAGIVESLPKIGTMEENPWADESTPGYLSPEQRKAIEDGASGVKGIWETLTNDIGNIVEGSMGRINNLLAPQPGKLPEVQEPKPGGLTAPDSLFGKGTGKGGGSDSTLQEWKTELQELIADAREAGLDTKAAEHQFWLWKVEEARKGSKEYAYALEEANKLAKEIYHQEQRDREAELKQQEQIDRIDEPSKLKHVESMESIEANRIRTMGQLGEISEADEIRALAQIEEQKYQMELQALRDRIAVRELEPVEIERINEKIKALEDKRNAAILAADNKLRIEQTNTWKSIAKSISSTLTSAVTSMLQGTQTLANGLKSIWNSIAAHIIGKIIETTVTFLANEIRKTVMAWTHEGGRTAAATAGAVARDGIQDASAAKGLATSAATGMKSIFNDAKKGAAGAYAALAEIPIIGPALGAAAAAVVFAAIMAFGTLTSAAGGWGEVPSDQLAMVHKSEMVLPAHLARTIREIADPSATIARAVSLTVSSALGPAGPLASAATGLRTGLAASLAPALSIAANGPAMALSGIGSYGIPADKLTFTRAALSGGLSFGAAGAGVASGTAARGRSGGDMHVHIPVTAMDPKGVARVLENSSSDVNKLFRDWARRGKLNNIPRRYRGR